MNGRLKVSIPVIALAIIALAASAVCLFGESLIDSTEDPDAVELTSYFDGVYDGTVVGDTISFEITDLEECGKSDIVLFGSNWISMNDPIVIRAKVIELFNSGVAVASTDPSIFKYLDSYAYSVDASLNVMLREKETGCACSYGISTYSEQAVFEGLASWLKDSRGFYDNISRGI